MRLLFCFVVFFNCTCFYGAQDTLDSLKNEIIIDSSTLNPVRFNEEHIENYKKDGSFNYLDEVENDSWWTRFKRWIQLKYQQLLNWLFGDYEANSILSFILYVLPYLLLGILIGLVAWLFMRFNPGAAILQDPAKAEVFFNEEEKIIRSQDISTLIKSAINEGNYRLAVRYYYLQLLKILNEKELINYEYQKTNSEYLNEIKEEHIKSPLKKVMRLYDFIWYGNFPVTNEDFTLAQHSFQHLEDSLKLKGNE